MYYHYNHLKHYIIIGCNDIIITISDKTQGWNERNIIHFIMYSHYLLFPPLSYFCIQYYTVCVSKIYLHIFRFCCVFVYTSTSAIIITG